jgi:dihydrofolate reductase
VSSSLVSPRWTNATVLRGDLVQEITRLKHAYQGEILVYASYDLVRALIEHGLSDQLRLVVFPTILGSGRRLFGDLIEAKGLRLVDERALGTNLTFMNYEFLE